MTFRRGGRQAGPRLVEATPFALVLLDIEMPGVSGLDVLRVDPQARSASELPVIMVTARHESARHRRSPERGANDYVTKPVDFPVALARIQTQLARKAEAALRESEERYALAVRGANDGLWDWNLQDRCHLLLAALEADARASRITRSRTNPTSGSTRLHPEEVEHVRGALAAHLDGRNDHFESEHRMLHADGTYRWMRAAASPSATQRARRYRMAGSQTDITEGKVADRAHRPAESRPVSRSPRTVDRAEHAARRVHVRGALRRSRSVQARERQPWP